MNIKRLYRNLSIRSKLILMILTAISTITFIILTILVSMEYNDEIDKVVATTELNAKLIGDYSSTALLFQDIKGAEEILDKLKYIDFITQATLYDIKTIEFTSYIRKNNKEIFSMKVNDFQDTTYFENDHLHVIHTIRYKNDKYGYIYIVASTKSFNSSLYDYALAVFLLFIVSLIISWLIAYLLQRTISRPIMDLVNYTQHITDNPETEEKIFRDSADEIGKLYKSFNDLFASLNQKERERQRTLDNLIASSLRFQAITENINDYIAILNSEGNFEYCNPTFSHIGYSMEDLIGKNFMNILKFEDSPKFKRLLIDVNSNNSTKFLEFKIQQNNGKFIFAEGVFIPMYDVPGVKGILTSFRDITQKKESEIAIKTSEEKLRSIINQAADAIYMVDLNGNFIDANDYASKITGYTIEELLSMNVNQLEAIKTNFEVNEIIEGIKLGEHISFETVHRRKDGSTFPVDVKIGKIKLQNEYCLLSYVRDITARKNQELEIKKKTDELDRYFNSSLDLLSIATYDGYFHRLNPEWENLLGYNLEELQKTRFIDFIHPEDLESTLDAIKDLSSAKSVLNFINRYRCKDGSYKWIEWRAFPIEGFIYAVARDITEKKIDEREKERLTKELIEKNKELEQIIYVTSHDLRSPLVNVQGFSTELQISLSQLNEILSKLNFEADSKREIDEIVIKDIPNSLRFITTSITKMDNLIKALLKIS